MIGRIANLFMWFGSISVGDHRAYGFICQLIGNAMWAWIGFKRYEGKDRKALIEVSLVFCAIYIWNFYRWTFE